MAIMYVFPKWTNQKSNLLDHLSDIQNTITKLIQRPWDLGLPHQYLQKIPPPALLFYHMIANVNITKQNLNTPVLVVYISLVSKADRIGVSIWLCVLRTHTDTNCIGLTYQRDITVCLTVLVEHVNDFIILRIIVLLILEGAILNVIFVIKTVVNYIALQFAMLVTHAFMMLWLSMILDW